LVWICDNCEQGNMDDHTICLHCAKPKKGEDVERQIHCWDYLDCEFDNRDNCIVFNKKNGTECYEYKKISRRCLGHSDKNCDDCEWFQFLQNKFECDS
jgi:hypothetical protein